MNRHQHILSESDKRPKETTEWTELTLNVKKTSWRDFWRKINKLWQLRWLETFGRL
jgi:hypothetical protein